MVFKHQIAFALSAGKLGFALSARPGYEVADLIVDLVPVPVLVSVLDAVSVPDVVSGSDFVSVPCICVLCLLRSCWLDNEK